MRITLDSAYADSLIVVKCGKPIGSVIEVDTRTKEYTQRSSHTYKAGYYDRLVIPSDKIPEGFANLALLLARSAGIEIVGSEELKELGLVE